jgi:hypothetical protein
MEARNPQQMYSVANIVWLVFMASQIIFAFAAYFLHQKSGITVEATLAAGLQQPIVIAVGAMSVMNIVLSQILPKIMVRPGTEVAAERSFQLTILRCTLTETVGLFGFIAAFLTHQPKLTYIFCAVSFMVNIINKPLRDDFK